MFGIIATVIGLSIVIIAHEFGHFLVAKKTGVKVEVFSLGYGKKLYGADYKGTEFRISMIPFGGYVKMKGEDPAESKSGAKDEYSSKTPLQRIIIVSAGSIVNYLMGVLIFVIIFISGAPYLTTEVGGLIDKYPAKEAGIKLKDSIISIDAKSVQYWDEMTALIHNSRKGEVVIGVLRDGQYLTFKIKPVSKELPNIFGKKQKLSLIGISPSDKVIYKRFTFLAAINEGVKKAIDLTCMTYRALLAMIVGALSIKQFTSPLGIFIISSKAMEVGFIYFLQVMAVLNIGLAIFNMLPIPVTDGGHILFIAIEKLRGRPISAKAQGIITQVFFYLLIAFALFIVYSDFEKFGLQDKFIKLWKH